MKRPAIVILSHPKAKSLGQTAPAPQASKPAGHWCAITAFLRATLVVGKKTERSPAQKWPLMRRFEFLRTGFYIGAHRWLPAEPGKRPAPLMQEKCSIFATLPVFCSN